MATGSYQYVLASAESSTGSSTGYRWNYIGTRMSGVNTDVRNKIPKFAKINSASVTIDIKRDGTSDLNMYDHDAAWDIRNEAGTVTKTVWSEDNAIERSYRTFTQSVLSYIDSSNANAGVASSIYVLSFYASGSLSKKYTTKNRKIDMTFTYPTITVVGKVNNSGYGEVKSVTHTLGSPIDIDTKANGFKQTCELIANPKTGYKFVRWSDGNTDRMREVELSEDVLTAHNTTLTFTAEFEPIIYNVTVSASPAEGGQTSANMQAYYGAEIILRAVANEGYRFVKWSDGNTNADRTVTVTADAHYTAEFEPIMFAVATGTLCDDGTAGGIVTGGGSYASGSTVTLTATPNEGYEFVQWSDGNTDEVRILTATADSLFTAEFKVLKFTITMQVTPEGAGAVGGAGTYNWNTLVELYVAVKQGYRFVKWSDGVTSARRTVLVREDATYTAIFELDETKQIFIGTWQVKSVHYTAATKTITFVVDCEVSTETDVVDTIDGYHLAISNTAPTDAVEVVGVYVGTKQVHSS